MEFIDQAISLFSDFSDPRKRIFVGYLALSIGLAIGWLILVKRQNIRGAFARVFDRKIIFSKSSMADYKIFVINGLINLFISPFFVTQLAVATSVFYLLHRQEFLSAGLWNDAPVGIVIGLFSVAMFMADDFSKYLLHRWMHKWPPLWAIHKVHHSAETMTPITVYRIHPLEGVFYALRGALAQGVVMATFIFLFGNTVDLYTVLGVNVLVFVFHVTGSNLRHSHISIQYWPWLEHIFISPAQHQLHHSIAEQHFDKNFGAALALWDWMFGSLHLSETDTDLAFGLGPDDLTSFRIGELYLRPVVEMSRAFKRRIKRGAKRVMRVFTPS